MALKPLFVPFKRCYFEQFSDGSKTVELRRYGARWNEGTCVVGRDVVISLGYSGPRLTARVVSFSASPMRTDIYGETLHAVIGLELQGPEPQVAPV